MEKTPRFLSPADVAETLNITVSQVMALIASGDLVSVQIGGRKVHRIEVSELEAYIGRLYDESRKRQQRTSADLPAHDG
jgi:excisionase family DNA binding protein